MNEVRIATRRSVLALAQAGRVADLLRAAHPALSVRLVPVETTGDRDRQGAIADLSEMGAFVRSVQERVVDGTADFAVHSLKDLPVWGPEELVLAAFPERGSPWDVLVGSSLDGLPPGSVVGTGSPRRVAQLMQVRPDLTTKELRGNVDTRLLKVAERQVDAAVLAEAGLDRLGKSELIAQRFDASLMVPAPGQGALAVEARRGSGSAELAATIDDGSLRTLLQAERLLLSETGAGCRSALGALASWVAGRIKLETFVADERGGRRSVVFGETPEAVVAEAREGDGDLIRVAVTTDRFGEAAEAFRRVGLTPVWLPCIRIEPAAEDVLAEAREAASIADLLLITSVRTLDVLWDNRTMPAVAVAAVGEKTAAAVTARGGRVVIVGRAGLADLVERSARQLGSSQVVFLHASGSDPAALEQLLASATNLRIFEVYRTVPVAPALTPVQAAAFASPSAVEGWLLSRDLDGVVIGVIGATTWDAVARHRRPEVVAPQPQHQALADAMASFLEVAV